MGDNKLLAVDLFSGAGGLSLGFLQTGQVEIAAAVENNEYAQKTYKNNHNRYNGVGNNIEYYDDIRKVNFQEIINKFEKIDLVFGGPPCQGFSNANRQKSELISTNNQLVKEYVRAIEELKPNAFVMENVKAMKSDKHKFFYSSKDQREIVEKLGIEVISDKVVLGRQNDLTDDLVCFLRKCLQERIDLSPYIISDKYLFSKLCHISRKENEADIYIVKAQNALQKTLLSWMKQHNNYWSPIYKEHWLQLGALLLNKNLDNSSWNELFEILNRIITVQKILKKINEIQCNGIEINDILQDHKNICLEVKTYGVLNYLTSKFDSLGYVMNEELIINAAHFGAPQLRERLVLIGIKKEFVGNNPVVLPVSIIKESDRFYKVEDAIGDLEELEPFKTMEADQPIDKPLFKISNPLLRYLHGTTNTIQNHVITDTTSTALKRFEVLKPGQNFHDLDESYKETYSDPGRTQNTVYLRLNYKAPSGTVLNVRKSMWIHPKKNRAISIREAARLQTFPDDFIFEGSKDSQYQQIGNAVPPILGRAIAEQVLRYLNTPAVEMLESIIRPQ